MKKTINEDYEFLKNNEYRMVKREMKRDLQYSIIALLIFASVLLYGFGLANIKSAIILSTF